MWMTLLAVLIGEQLMGIPGMILAPVVLSFIKVEMQKVPVLGSALPKPAPKQRELAEV